MSDRVRTHIFLEKKQRMALDAITEQSGVSRAQLVRDLLNAPLRARAYAEMRLAAHLLRDDYRQDPELTNLTALDGEDFA